VSREGTEPKGSDAPALRPPGPQRAAVGREAGSDRAASNPAAGEAGVVHGDANTENGYSPSEARAKEVPLEEGLRRLEAANQFLEPYDDDCSELLRLPAADRDRCEEQLGSLAVRTPRLLEKFREVKIASLEEEAADSETAE
jgi:hypothetical protein